MVAMVRLARQGALALGIALLLTAAVVAQSAPPHRAGLVIVHGDGQVVTRCVAFDEEAISGIDLLRRSDIPLVLSAYGGLGYGVCAIDGEGCADGQDCFCQCRGNPCAYWTYSHRRPDGSWAISGVGAAGWLLHDGDVDGWVWGDGTVAPPALALSDICPDPSVAEPTATPAATATLLPLPAVPASLPAASAPNGYLFFALMVAFLLGGLVWAVLRRR